MNRTGKRVALILAAAMILLIGGTAFAQGTCVLHPAGDMVPCVHWIATIYGPRLAHPFDVAPCTHFVPCY